MTRISGIAALACRFALLCVPALRAKTDAWVEVRNPHFIVVSNAGEKEARHSVRCG